MSDPQETRPKASAAEVLIGGLFMVFLARCVNRMGQTPYHAPRLVRISPERVREITGGRVL